MISDLIPPFDVTYFQKNNYYEDMKVIDRHRMIIHWGKLIKSKNSLLFYKSMMDTFIGHLSILIL